MKILDNVINAASLFRPKQKKYTVANFVEEIGSDLYVEIRKVDVMKFSDVRNTQKEMFVHFLNESIELIPCCKAVVGFYYNDKGCCDMKIYVDPDLAEIMGLPMFEGYKTNNLVRESNSDKYWMEVHVEAKKIGDLK